MNAACICQKMCFSVSITFEITQPLDQVASGLSKIEQQRTVQICFSPFVVV